MSSNMPVNNSRWACSKCFAEPGQRHESWCDDEEVKAFFKVEWNREMQDALDSIPREFVGNDYWVNGIKRMAEEIKRLRGN